MTEDHGAERTLPGWRPNRDAAFEVAFGQRIRGARVAAGMTQVFVGEALGISFQQVQKHELGKDRISVGTLKAFAEVLGVEPGSFFSEDSPAKSSSVKDMREVQRLGERIIGLPNPVITRRIMALVDVLAPTGVNGANDAHYTINDDPETKE